MSPDRHHLATDRGSIVARRVIVATNAFTRELLPEMRSISPRQSQIMLTEHALDRARGRTISTEQGPASSISRALERAMGAPRCCLAAQRSTNEESLITP